jgi:hypothetical protein
VTKMYPLLDERTSHFLMVTGAVLAAVGICGAATAAIRIGRNAGTRSAAVVLLAVAGFAVANHGVLAHPPRPGPPGEDIRAQVEYVAAHRQPGDIVLVNLSGQYGFAYYWSGDEPQFHRGGVQATGWYMDYPSRDGIVVATGRDQASVLRAVAAADAVAGPGGRIWLVRTHVNSSEAQAWQQALAGAPVQLFVVGPEPLAAITVN